MGTVPGRYSLVRLRPLTSPLRASAAQSIHRCTWLHSQPAKLIYDTATISAGHTSSPAQYPGRPRPPLSLSKDVQSLRTPVPRPRLLRLRLVVQRRVSSYPLANMVDRTHYRIRITLVLPPTYTSHMESRRRNSMHDQTSLSRRVHMPSQLDLTSGIRVL